MCWVWGHNWKKKITFHEINRSSIYLSRENSNKTEQITFLCLLEASAPKHTILFFKNGFLYCSRAVEGPEMGCATLSNIILCEWHWWTFLSSLSLATFLMLFLEASYHTEIICSSEFGNESLSLLLLSDLIQKERWSIEGNF